MKRTFAFVLITALLMSPTCWAYGRKGHAIIGHVAQVNLTAEARAGVRAELCGEILSDIANWGDDIHNDPNFKGIVPLHYVDFPNGATTYQAAVKSPDGDLVLAALSLEEYLKTGDENILAKVVALKGIGRKAALKLLVHFYGDLHQPLHTGNGEDAGGNAIKVIFFGKPSNLHSAWDKGLLDGRPEWDAIHYAHYLIRHFRGEDSKSWQTGGPVDWANFSFSLRDKLQEYPDKQSDDPKDLPIVGYRYGDVNIPLLERQLWLGGMRLAYAINQIYKSK